MHKRVVEFREDFSKVRSVTQRIHSLHQPMRQAFSPENRYAISGYVQGTR